jgi:hypothetical protein
MLRYIFTYLFLIVASSACGTQKFQVDGYLDDVSPNGQYVLYEAPDVWELDEYRFGNLRVMDVKTGKITIIPDQVLINECGSFFLNDSIVAMQPGGGRVELYNFQTETLEKDPLLTYGNKGFIPLQFALNEDRTKAALLLLDTNKKLKDTDSSDEPICRVELKVVDLKSGQEYIDENYDYRLGTDIHKGNIRWHGNNDVIYAYEGNRHYYNLVQRKSLSSANYESDLALHQDGFLYRGKNLSIQELITEVPDGPYKVDKHELLIIRT